MKIECDSKEVTGVEWCKMPLGWMLTVSTKSSDITARFGTYGYDYTDSGERRYSISISLGDAYDPFDESSGRVEMSSENKAESDILGNYNLFGQAGRDTFFLFSSPRTWPREHVMSVEFNQATE